MPVVPCTRPTTLLSWQLLFGTTKLDEANKKQRMLESGELDIHSTTWAWQMRRDMVAFADVAEDNSWWQESGNNIKKLFASPDMVEAIIKILQY